MSMVSRSKRRRLRDRRVHILRSAEASARFRHAFLGDTRFSSDEFFPKAPCWPNPKAVTFNPVVELWCPTSSPTQPRESTNALTSTSSSGRLSVPEIVERIQQRSVEQVVHVPGPHVQEVVVHVPKIMSQERTQHRSVEHVVEVTPHMIEKVVHVPKIVEMEQPTIIQKTIRHRKPILQEQISEVVKVVEQIVPIEKFVDVPVVKHVQAPQARTVQKTVEVQQFQCIDQVVDVPVVKHVDVPQVQTMQRTVEVQPELRQRDSSEWLAEVELARPFQPEFGQCDVCDASGLSAEIDLERPFAEECKQTLPGNSDSVSSAVVSDDDDDDDNAPRFSKVEMQEAVRQVCADAIALGNEERDKLFLEVNMKWQRELQSFKDRNAELLTKVAEQRECISMLEVEELVPPLVNFDDCTYFCKSTLDRLEQWQLGKLHDSKIKSAWRRLEHPETINRFDMMEPVSLPSNFIGIHELLSQVGPARASRILQAGRRKNCGPGVCSKKWPEMTAQQWLYKLNFYIEGDYDHPLAVDEESDSS